MKSTFRKLNASFLKSGKCQIVQRPRSERLISEDVKCENEGDIF